MLHEETTTAKLFRNKEIPPHRIQWTFYEKTKCQRLGANLINPKMPSSKTFKDPQLAKAMVILASVTVVATNLEGATWAVDFWRGKQQQDALFMVG